MTERVSSRLRQRPLLAAINLGVAAALVLLITVGNPRHTLAHPATPAKPSSNAQQLQGSTGLDLANPVSLLESVGGIWANDDAEAEESAEPGAGSGLSATISILVLLTVLSVAPAIVVLTTCFTRVVIVLALLRQAIGTQSLPPSQVLVGLAMFLTILVMAPTFDRINREALVPLQNREIDQLAAWSRARQPLRDFMFSQIEHAGNWSDIYMILNYRGVDTSTPDALTRADVDMISLIPAFILSELKVAFLMGFRFYLPFLIIDMVVASVLLSMGMMMLPPVLVSLPFKLLMFVLVDGWNLVVGNLLNSFSIPGIGN